MLLKGNVTVPQGGTLMVNPGAIVKLGGETGSVIVAGTLDAQGTVAQPVIFTSYRDDSAGGDTNNNGADSGGNGDWGDIQFGATSTNNALSFVEVRYGGGWGPSADEPPLFMQKG